MEVHNTTMENDTVWATYAAAVADVLEREPGEIRLGLHFQDDLKIDSLGFFELMLELEESFDIDIDEEQAEAVRTTDEGFALVRSYLDG